MLLIFQTNNFPGIIVYGDGQCLFRCYTIYSHNELESCKRTNFGLLILDRSSEKETQFAKSLRAEVVSVLAKNVTELTNMEKELPFIFDREVGIYLCYSTVSNKIHHMRNPSEFVGNLEILALSFHTKHQICIYEKIGNEVLCLRAEIQLHCNNWPIVHVSYRLGH